MLGESLKCQERQETNALLPTLQWINYLKGLPVVCKPVNSSNIGSRVASIGRLQYWTIVPTLVVCKEQVEEMQPGVEREWIPFSERQYVKKA